MPPGSLLCPACSGSPTAACVTAVSQAPVFAWVCSPSWWQPARWSDSRGPRPAGRGKSLGVGVGVLWAHEHPGVQLWGPIAGTGQLDLFLLIHEECLTVCAEGQQSLADRGWFWSQKTVTRTLDLPWLGNPSRALNFLWAVEVPTPVQCREWW